jgi:hypothetical protein
MGLFSWLLDRGKDRKLRSLDAKVRQLVVTAYSSAPGKFEIKASNASEVSALVDQLAALRHERSVELLVDLLRATSIAIWWSASLGRGTDPYRDLAKRICDALVMVNSASTGPILQECIEYPMDRREEGLGIGGEVLPIFQEFVAQVMSDARG